MIQNKIEIQRKNLRMKIPRYLLKENIEKFVEKRREEIKKKIVSLNGATIFSGECSIAYWIKIVGIKNLYSLLIPKKFQ